MLPLTPEGAGEQLLHGEIDAAFMLTSWESPVVRQLLGDSDIELASFHERMHTLLCTRI